MFTATERLYQTADLEELVPEGDERAAFLFTIPGREVSDEDAERYGLKEAGRPANKAAKPAANKTAKAAKKAAPGITIIKG